MPGGSATRMWTGGLAFVAGLGLSACFDDNQDSGGDGCPDGTDGCACYGNETCDDGLDCLDGACQDPNCPAGSNGCACLLGSCIAGLACDGDKCRPTGDTGGGSQEGTSAADDGSTSGDGGSTSAATATGADTTSTATDGTTGPGTSSSSSSSSSTSSSSSSSTSSSSSSSTSGASTSSSTSSSSSSSTSGASTSSSTSGSSSSSTSGASTSSSTGLSTSSSTGLSTSTTGPLFDIGDPFDIGGNPFDLGGGGVARLVFATSTPYDGNLGGLDGADSLCQQAAEDAGLPGTYQAWLSDSTGSPSTRFIRGTGGWELVDGTRIADDWNDLTDGTIQAPIDLDEHGLRNVGNFACQGGELWSNTTDDGSLRSGNHCGDWSDSVGTSSAGNVTLTDGSWTESPCRAIGCMAALPLYCFEQ